MVFFVDNIVFFIFKTTNNYISDYISAIPAEKSLNLLKTNDNDELGARRFFQKYQRMK